MQIRVRDTPEYIVCVGNLFDLTQNVADTRYESHPEQVILTMPAGSALFLNGRMFHGTMPNVGNHDRRMVAIAYRPTWAGPSPIGDPLPPWDPASVNRMPAALKVLFSDPNLREGFCFQQPNKPQNMATEAAGLDPSRWQDSSMARL